MAVGSLKKYKNHLVRNVVDFFLSARVCKLIISHHSHISYGLVILTGLVASGNICRKSLFDFVCMEAKKRWLIIGVFPSSNT